MLPLMLIFETLRATSHLPGSEAFVAAFQGTFRIAAAIPAALIVVELARRRGAGPEPPSPAPGN
jgi:hypothetical protein